MFAFDSAILGRDIDSLVIAPLESMAKMVCDQVARYFALLENIVVFIILGGVFHR